MTIYYIDTPGVGTQDGLSWTNAAPLSLADDKYALCQPGDEIWINSLVPHTLVGTLGWTNANNPTDTNRIKIRGMRKSGTVQGYPEKATIYGGRTTPWPATGGSNSGTLFRLDAGFKFTTIENIVGVSYQSMFLTNDATVQGVKIQDCEAVNVQHGFSNGVSLATSNWRFRRFNIYGFTGRGISFGGTMSDIVVEDCEAYCLGQDDNDTGNAPFAFFMDVNSSNGRFRRCRAIGGMDIRPDANYWQGDGFCSEEGAYNVVYEDCYASDWGDGGWDIKSSNTTLKRCVSERNKRNYRFHYQRVVGQAGTYQVEDSVSRYPIYRGGTGGIGTHVDISNGISGSLTLVNWKAGAIEDHEASSIIVLCAGSFTGTTFNRTLIRRHPNATVISGTQDTTTFTNCVTETES